MVIEMLALALLYSASPSFTAVMITVPAFFMVAVVPFILNVLGSELVYVILPSPFPPVVLNSKASSPYVFVATSSILKSL